MLGIVLNHFVCSFGFLLTLPYLAWIKVKNTKGIESKRVETKALLGPWGLNLDIVFYDEIRYAKTCKKLKLEDLGYSCEEIENQN